MSKLFTLHRQVLDQVRVAQNTINALQNTVKALADNVDAHMIVIHGMASYVQGMQFPLRHAMGQSFHNMSVLDYYFRPLLHQLPHDAQDRRMLSLLPRAQTMQSRPRFLPILPTPSAVSNQLSVITIDSRDTPSTPLRSQRPPAQTQTPPSMSKKRKAHETTEPEKGSKREPIPSKGKDVATIRGVVKEWRKPNPPHCSLNDMMMGTGPDFDAWRKDHKSWIDHRKNIWWAISARVQELTDMNCNEQSIVEEVTLRLEREQGSMTVPQFIKQLPSPPANWRSLVKL